MGTEDILSGVPLNAANLLPVNKHFSYFKDSLTTSPCSEGVNWFAMQKAIEVSKEQIAQFNKVIGGNARPTHSLNGRNILMN